MAKKLGTNAQKLKNLKSYVSKQQSQSSANNMQNSINNYKTRLNAAGVNTEEATDNRNWFEKLTNLPEGQNFLFDAFELLGRPQQALFGAIQGLQEGEDALEYAKAGFSGEETYHAGDILRNMGVSDEKLITNPITKEDTSLADILGLGADILADPIDLIPAGSLIKAGKVANAASDVKKATKALDAANVLGDVTKINDATKALDMARTAEDIVKATKYKGSLLEAGMQGIAGGTKKAVGSAITKGADIADVSKIGKLAKANGIIDKGTKVTKDMIPELTTKLSDIGINVNTKSDMLKTAKKAFSKTTDYAGSFEGDLYNRVKRGENEVDIARAYGTAINSDLTKKINDYAKKTGKNTDSINRDIQSYIGSKYNPKIKMSDYIDTALSNKGKSDVINGSKKQIDKLVDKLNNFVSKNSDLVTENSFRIKRTGDTSLIIEGNPKLLKAIKDNDDLMDQLSKITYKKGRKFDSSVSKDLTRIRKDIKDDEDFASLIKDAESNYSKFLDFVSTTTGKKINFSELAREGFISGSLNDEGKRIVDILEEEKLARTASIKSLKNPKDELYKGSSKTFSGKRFSNQTQQGERELAKEISKSREGHFKKLESLRSRSYESDVEKLKSKISDIDVKKSERTSKFKEKITNLGIKETRANKLVKKYDKANDNLSELISEEVVKKAKTIDNIDLSSDLLKKSEKYNNKLRKLEDIKNNLVKEGLTKKQYEKYLSDFEKATESVQKAKNDVIFQAAKIKGAVDEKFIKEAGKLADDMSKKAANATKQAGKQTVIRENTRALKKQLNQNYNKVINDFNKQQADLRLELSRLENMTPEQIKKYNQDIADQVAREQRILDVFESVKGKKLFNEMFTETFDSFVNKTSNQAKALLGYNEILAQSTLENSKVIKYFKPGEPIKDVVNMVEMPPGFKKKMLGYLDDMKNFMPEGSDLAKRIKKQLSLSKTAYIDKDILELVEIGARINKGEVNVLLNTIDRVNNTFKKFSTLTPGFLIRNMTGNASNMWLSGMSAKDISLGYAKATKLSKSDYIIDLITKKANNTLNAKELKDYNVIQQFIESGALGNSKDIRDLGELVEKAAKSEQSKNMLKKAWDGMFSINAKGNQKMDNLSRMALLNYASNNPKYVTKLGANDAIDAMKKVLFDPQNMSPFEQKYIKRIVPFYTFTKQNLMFQMKNVMNNTSRYNRLMKTFNSMYDAVGEGNYRQYQKENFEIPIGTTDGGTLTLKSNLPISDLGEYIENPLQRLVSSTSPLIKTPIEKVTGTDLFTGMDISDQSGFETLSKALGLSNATKLVDGISQVANDEAANDLAALLPSVIRYTDTEKIANQEQYQELMEYQKLVKELKNQGIDVPTIKELTNSTNRSINAINKRRNNQKRR